MGESHVYPTCKDLFSKHITSRSPICWRRWKAIYGKGSLDDFIFARDYFNGYILHTGYYSIETATLEIFLVQGIHKFLYVPTSTSLDTRDYSIRNIDFPGVTICPNSKIMKSSFRAAMSSSKLSWANITAKMDEEAATEFRYSVLDYLANMVLFSGNPAGVMN